MAVDVFDGMVHHVPLDRATFRKFAKDIAWETEVWIAESPDHLIHFNGEKFLGPHASTGRQG
jgi:type II restriction enzyme